MNEKSFWLCFGTIHIWILLGLAIFDNRYGMFVGFLFGLWTSWRFHWFKVAQ